MIKAQHKKWARIIFDLYINSLLKKNFSRFLLTNEFPKINQSAGLIITPNHFSWWDGFFIDFYTQKILQRKIHLLMLEEQLKRYWFFKKVGAYSINVNNPKSVIETFNYTSRILNDQNNFVVYYPQGKIEEFGSKSLTFKEGIVKVIKQTSIAVEILPIAFKIHYSNFKLPDILVRVGEKIIATNRNNLIDELKYVFTENVNQLDEYIVTGNEQNLFMR
jgi:1-acyl-sn-glycerol-3-phosphate acyltransferase